MCRARRGSQAIFEDIAESVSRFSAADSHAECAFRMDVLEWALCLGGDFDWTSADPRTAGPLAGLLGFKSQVESASSPVWGKFHLSAFEYRQLCIEAGEFFGLQCFQFCGQRGWNERWEMGRPFLLFPARKRPRCALQNSIKGVVVGGGNGVVLVVMTSCTSQREPQQGASDRINPRRRSRDTGSRVMLCTRNVFRWREIRLL